MPLLKNYCEVKLEANLDELRRKDELESLRPHIAHAACFHPSKNPETTTIGIDDLKRMARAWKLHEKTRNYWKTHTNIEALMDSLLQYIRDTGKVTPLSKAQQEMNLSPEKPLFAPLPPQGHRASSFHVPASGKGTNNRRSIIASPRGMSSTSPKNLRFDHFKTKFFGVESKFANTTTESMLVHTRFYKNEMDEKSDVKSIVENWRATNFSSTGGGHTAAKAAKAATSAIEEEQAVEIRDAKVLKQRNIATHLHNLSADPTLVLDQLNRNALEAFLAAAESDDVVTVEKSMMSFANVTASQKVRALAMEISILHRAQTIFPMLQSNPSTQAAVSFIHQMSQDGLFEDKVYNSCFATMQGHCLVPDQALVMTTIYSLNNLLPCSEPQRVGELIIATISSLQTKEQSELHRIFEVVFNMSTFLALHDTLVECEVVQMISQAAASAGAVGDVTAARLFALFLHNVTVSAESMAPALMKMDYVATFLDLNKIKDPIIVKYTIRTLAVLSASTTTKLCVAAADHEIVSLVMRHVEAGLAGDDTVPAPALMDAVKFLHNVMCNTSKSREVAFQVLEQVGIVTLLLKLCTHSDAKVRSMAATSLRAGFTNKGISARYAATATKPLLGVMELDNNVDAVLAVQNLACAKEAELVLVRDGVHIRLLNWMATTTVPAVKAACLKVLVQMTINEEAVLALLASGLIPKLLTELKNFEPAQNPNAKKSYYEEEAVPPGDDEVIMWLAISRVCCAVAARKLDMARPDREGLEQILIKVCVPLAGVEVLTQCTWCMSFLSLSPMSFEPIEAQLKVVLEAFLHEHESLMETCASMFYNLTCQGGNSEMLLRTEYYLNIMIHMMRGGGETVQSFVVEAMRNMCCDPQAAHWLLKKDILPDFVVIALLRTNSETIKSVCCDAFYNLLCHETTRPTFLAGDLWWATMKVARSEVERIRVVSAKALFNMSCRPDFSVGLRKQGLISFTKDFVHFAAGSQTFLKTVLLSVHNAVSRFETPLDANERTCAIELAMTGITVCSEPEPVALALKILLKAAHDTTSSDKNFIELDIIGCIEKNRGAWIGSAEATVLVSHALYQMCMEPGFTKAVPFIEMQQCLMLVHSNLFELAGAGSVSGLNICVFVRENTAAILAMYAQRREAKREALLKCPLWQEVVALPVAARDKEDPNSNVTSPTLRNLALEMTTYCIDALVLGRPVSGRPPTAINPDSPNGPGAGAVGMSPLFASSPGRTSMVPLSPVTTKHRNSSTPPSSRPSSRPGTGVVNGEFLDHLTVEIIRGLIGVDLLFSHTKGTEPQYDPMTGTFKSADAITIERGYISTLNMMMLIDALCQAPRTAQMLVTADVPVTMLGLLNIDRAGLPVTVTDALDCSIGGLERYVTSILLSLSAEPLLLEGLLESSALAVCLNKMLDCTVPGAGAAATKAESYAGEIFRDMATILYRFAHCNLNDENPMNSQLIINLCETMLTRSMEARDVTCERICRHVIGFTMDKFRLDSTCSIDNVQTMLMEMNDDASSEIPLLIMQRIAVVPELRLRQPADAVMVRGSGFAHCALVQTDEPSGCWKLISVTKLKKMNALLDNMNSANPNTDFSCEKVELFALTGYHKMESKAVKEKIFPSSPNFKKGKGPGVASGGLVLDTDGDIQGYDDDDFENDDGGGDNDLRLPQTVA